MVLEDPVLLLCGVVQSCQRKEGPLAGVQPVKVAKAFLPQTPLLSVVRGQKLSLGSGLLDPGHNQLIHQLKQAQIQTALLGQELQLQAILDWVQFPGMHS